MQVTDKLYADRKFRRGESNSFGGFASARGLAKMAAYMANEGTFEGKQLIKKETWDKFHANPSA
mgnify:CR=1 FL=1|jgi:hypothetical protein